MQVYLRPAPRPGLGRALDVPDVIAPQPVVYTRAAIIDRRVRATGYVFSGIFSAASLLLFALGKDRAGYMLGIASALWGAASGAIQVYAEKE